MAVVKNYKFTTQADSIPPIEVGGTEDNHPSHYGGIDNPYEVIKVLEAHLTRDEMIGFCQGNKIKYDLRWRHKGGVSDLKKSRFYSNFLVDYLERYPE